MKRRPQEPKPTPPDRLALVRDHELLDLISALDQAHDDVLATIDRLGKISAALKRVSDYLREQRERQQR